MKLLQRYHEAFVIYLLRYRTGSQMWNIHNLNKIFTLSNVFLYMWPSGNLNCHNLIDQNYLGWWEPRNRPNDTRPPFLWLFVTRSGGMGMRLTEFNNCLTQLCRGHLFWMEYMLFLSAGNCYWHDIWFTIVRCFLLFPIKAMWVRIAIKEPGW